MLVGQTIGAGESLLISLVGMGVVMLELALLALFILCMTKVVTMLSAKKETEVKQTAAAAPAVTEPAGFNADEMAAVLACVCAETGRRPEQILIRSVELK